MDAHLPKSIFFSTQAVFRKWLEKNHEKAGELLVGFYKVNSGKPSIRWSESVDEAICFGWIDGVRRSIDEESYCIRFTPRKSTSIWSAINIKKVEELTKKELMHPAGTMLFRKEKNTNPGSILMRNKPKIYQMNSWENLSWIKKPGIFSKHLRPPIKGLRPIG